MDLRIEAICGNSRYKPFKWAVMCDMTVLGVFFEKDIAGKFMNKVTHKELLKIVKQLYEGGMTIDQICAKINRKKRTVQVYIK